jgi:amino-acid N-acetyltransferase
MISLRPATSDDQAAIVRLVRAGGVNPMGVHWPRFVVAVEDSTGSVVGIGQIKQHRDGSHELASIVTAAEYQRRGIARRIIEHLLAGHTGDLYLICLSTLGPFYEQFGFRAVEDNEMPPYFRRLKALAKAFALLPGSSTRLLVMKHQPAT